MSRTHMVAFSGMFFALGLFSPLGFLCGWVYSAAVVMTCFWLPLGSAFARLAVFLLALTTGVTVQFFLSPKSNGTLAYAYEWVFKPLMLQIGFAFALGLAVIAVRRVRSTSSRAV